MTEARAVSEQQARPFRGRFARALLWYVLPGLVVAAVGTYVVGAVVLHANPPAVPVEGTSMRPTLQTGDLVILKGVDPRTLHKGDIIALRVPKDARSKYGLPADIVHRIVEVEHSSNGLVFQTKGDANPGPDVFSTPAGDVVGKMVARVPGLGYPFLFFRSRQGEIFLVAALFVVVVYFLLGFFEDRRAYTEASALVMQRVLEETTALKDATRKAEGAARAYSDRPPAPVKAGAPDGPEGLAEGLVETAGRARDTQETIRELMAAIGEYGEHLASHTAVMKGLAATSAEMLGAARSLNSALGLPAKLTASCEERSPVQAEGANRRAEETSSSRPTGRAAVPVTLRETYLAPARVALRRREQKMTIDPAQLRRPTLKRSLRGYSRGGVERLLGQAADALEQSGGERDELEERLRGAEEKLARHRRLEASLSQVLIAADKHANDLKEQSDREAKLVLAKAREIVQEQAAEHERGLAGAQGVRAQLEEVLGALNDRDHEEAPPRPDLLRGL